MKNLFGEAIERTFSPQDDNGPINLPSQTPTIYLFSSKPNRTDALAGTGAIETVSTWYESSVSPYERTFEFSAIDDPDPTSSTNYKTYYEAIIFKLESAEQNQLIIKAFDVYRVEATDSIPGITSEDIKKIYPDIASYSDDEDLRTAIQMATVDIKRDLKKRGLLWTRFFNLEETKEVIAYKVIAFVNLLQRVAVDDRFDLKYDAFTKKYFEAFNDLVLPYDSDGDGEADTIEQVEQSDWTITR